MLLGWGSDAFTIAKEKNRMKKSIKELEKQALDWASHTFEDGGIGGIPEFNRLFTEKYAELIVAECANWINNNIGLIDQDAKKALNKHMGIK